MFKIEIQLIIFNSNAYYFHSFVYIIRHFYHLIIRLNKYLIQI